MALFFISGKRKDKSDEELLELSRSTADKEYLGLLYERYMHLVYGICLKYYKDKDRSRDAVMQVYEKLVNDIHRHEIRHFKSWLYVLARNHCLMELRRDSTIARRSVKIISDRFMENCADLHPIDETNDDTMEKDLTWCLDQLKKLQRVCVELFYFKEKSYKEIATQLVISENNVKSYIQNGKRNLKMCIEQRQSIV